MLAGNVICTCFGVTEEEIERVVRDNNLSSVEQVTNYCKAGGGCGGCRKDIEKIILRIRKELEVKSASAQRPAKMTVLQKVKLIEETLDREIRPMLKRDGGDIELIDVSGTRVLVSFRGMCAGCQAAPITMKDVVEAKLREFVSADLTVEEDKS
jgi:NifU-like protein